MGARTQPRWSSLASITVGCAVLVLGFFSAMSPAAAHGGTAVFDVDVEERAPFEVSVDVGVRYSTDEEMAAGALVDLEAIGPGGERLDPVRLRRGRDDRYRARLHLPSDGRWDLELRSAFPPGTTTVAVDVAGAARADGGRGLTVALVGGAVIVVGLAAWLTRSRRKR